MFNAFALYDDGRTRAENESTAITDLAASNPACLWIDIEDPEETTLRALQDAFRLDAEALEDCISGDQRARIDEYDGYLFFITYGAVGNESPPEFDPRKLGIFYRDNLLITIHARSLVTTTKQIARVGRNVEKALQRGPAHLLHAVIDSLVDNYLLATVHYDACLDQLEEASVEPDQQQTILSDLGDVRRSLSDMRRSVIAHYEVVQSLIDEYDVLPETVADEFAHVIDHLRHAQEQIDALRELVFAIQQNHFAFLADRTNAFMRTLTLFATFLMPLSLVTGIYGMNIPLWPDPASPWSSVFALGTMGAITAAMFYYFKKHNLF